MIAIELEQTLQKGEDSQQQFKQSIINGNALATDCNQEK